MKKIYLDYAATAPADPRVIDAMKPYFFDRFGNASSPHSFGREAQKALEGSRETLAHFLKAKPQEIVFTSGATESNNHAVLGVAQALKDKGNHIVVASIEHHSVLGPLHFLEKSGYQITYLPVDSNGLIDPGQIRQAITDKTILVAVMHASNEIGTIEPVEEIGKITQERGVYFLVDAVQTVGHIPVQAQNLQADLLSLSAHKFYGPKGMGALYIREGTKIAPYLLGGDQERGRRASTQNVAGAVGLARAVEFCREVMGEEAGRQIEWRDRLLQEVPKRIDGVKINGHPARRLPNNAHFSFDGIEGESLLMSLDMAGIAASMGSACTSGAMEPSHVLRAVGLSDKLAFGSLRVTIGRWTTSEEIDTFLEQLPIIVKSLRI